MSYEQYCLILDFLVSKVEKASPVRRMTIGWLVNLLQKEYKPGG